MWFNHQHVQVYGSNFIHFLFSSVLISIFYTIKYKLFFCFLFSFTLKKIFFI